MSIAVQRPGPAIMPLDGSFLAQQPWYSGVARFTLTATTAGPGATVTIHRITPTGDSITISWGDGGADTVVADGVTANQTHVYAAADTYDITVTDAALITQLDIHDNQLSGFESAQLADNVITYFSVHQLGSAVACVVNSADMVLWNPSLWYLFSMPAGTYTIDSGDMTAWTSGFWWLYSMPAGTYTIDTADIALLLPLYWYLFSMPAGTYSIDTSDIAAWTPTFFLLRSMPVGTVFTIAQADFNGWITTTNFQMQNNGLPQADVDAIFQGFYGGFAARTAVGGTINVGGTNAAPSGVYAANCPPVTGKEWAFELVNDSCGISANHWTTVTFTP